MIRTIIQTVPLPGRVRHRLYGWYYSRRTRTRLTDEEVWDLHVALAALIADGTLRLKDAGHGHPARMTQKEWEETLTRIAAGFTRYADQNRGGNDPTVPAEALDLLKEVWLDLWD